MTWTYNIIQREEVTIGSVDPKKTKHTKSPDTNKHMPPKMGPDAYQCIEDDKLQFATQYLPDD